MITEEINKKLIEIYKAGEKDKVSVYRYFLSQVKNKEIELRPSGETVDDEKAFKILRKLVKQRKETIDMAEKAGRSDIVEKEQFELGVLREISQMYPFEMDL